jgi:hypothetical protein
MMSLQNSILAREGVAREGVASAALVQTQSRVVIRVVYFYFIFISKG